MFQFPKSQKLCAKKEIEKLFSKGKHLSEKPISIIWYFQDSCQNSFVKTVIIVSKKNIKKATSRNRIKRKIREIYRYKKSLVEMALKQKEKKINLAIIYKEEKKSDYNRLEEKINLLLTRLINEI